ncbi:MAG: hypothetical protein HY046_11695 [Acidobacteria bacterium]|nr:hypothetical protein [Acidobacteriota bacterium]
MTFTKFLSLSGALFVLAGVLQYFGKVQAAHSFLYPALAFLICGAVGMIHFFWNSTRKPR